jgi:hypothetical protein
VLSNSVKREVLWNVVEPGDPYDIKKFHSLNSGQRLRACQMISASPWETISTWSVCSRLQR